MHAMSGSGDITHDGRPAQADALDARRVLRLLARDLPASCRSPASSRRTRSSPARSRPRSIRRAGRAWVGKLLWASCCCSRRSAPRSTCRASTSWCSPATRRAPTTRSSTTSTSRRRSWSVPLVVLAVCATLIGFIGLPGHLARPPRAANLLAHAGSSRCVGPELRGPARRPRSASWSASTLLALIGIALAVVLLRRRLPAAGRARSPPQFPGFVRLVQDKFRVDELYDSLIIRPFRAVSRGLYDVRRSHHHRQDPGRGHRRASSTCSRGSRAPSRAATASATWRCSRSASALLVHFATPADAAVHQAEGHADGRARRDRRAPRQPRRRPRPLEYAFDFDVTAARSSRARRPSSATTYDRAGTLHDPRDDQRSALGHRRRRSRRRSRCR